MAVTAARRMAVWVAIFCAWAAVMTSAAPPRWQGTEATAVTDAWADEFDLDGDKDWLSDAPISPSSIPQQSDYEDYEDDEEEDASSPQQQSMEDAEEHQEDSEPNQAEFLFVPSKDNRLMLQDDDDDQNGLIKVRHTGKNPYPEVIDGDNSDDDSNDSSHQFEFTIDNGDDDDDKDNEVDDDTNDFVLDDAPSKDDNVEVLPRQEVRDDTDDDDEDDDDDNFVSDGDSNNDPMFEAPEEDSQVIYGDHVFLY